MKTILYAGSELLTGDEIADELMSLSQALAEAHAADTVAIPVISPDGRPGIAALLVGPASQIVVLTTSSDQSDLVDADAVARLREKTRRLRPVIGVADDTGDAARWTEEL